MCWWGNKKLEVKAILRKIKTWSSLFDQRNLATLTSCPSIFSPVVFPTHARILPVSQPFPFLGGVIAEPGIPV